MKIGSAQMRRINQQAVCGSHKSFMYQHEAEELAARHLDCRKCAPGWRMGAFRCGEHWHIGHGGAV